ncbi:MAG: MFS transporter, partial [Xenococcaceae cyanobacterium]
SPGLAGWVLMIGKAWDAVSDPLVGWLSDRTQSPWGRRYPWMIVAAPLLALFFVLLWMVPPLDSQTGLFFYYSVIALCTYTALTAVIVPFAALVPEITQAYNERISLGSFISSFDIGGTLTGLILAQIVFQLIQNPQQKYLLIAIIGAGISLLAMYISAWGTYPYTQQLQKQRPFDLPPPLPLQEQLKTILSNRPFLCVIGIYLFSWLGVSITTATLPYYIRNWMQLPDRYFTLSAILVQGTALLMLFIWNPVGHNFGKKAVYFMGVPVWLIAQYGLWLMQPGQLNLLYICAALGGVGVSVAYLVPGAMLPDVIDLDQLRTGQRREGVFYGFVVFLLKLSEAIALLLIGKILDWMGYIPGAASNLQPDSALWAIRALMGPIPASFLIGGLILAYFYPITKSTHEEIVSKLQKK